MIETRRHSTSVNWPEAFVILSNTGQIDHYPIHSSLFSERLPEALISSLYGVSRVSPTQCLTYLAALDRSPQWSLDTMPVIRKKASLRQLLHDCRIAATSWSGFGDSHPSVKTLHIVEQAITWDGDPSPPKALLGNSFAGLGYPTLFSDSNKPDLSAWRLRDPLLTRRTAHQC